MGKNVIISTLPNISQNYLPKVNTSNIFANSLVYDNGSTVFIGTTTTSTQYTSEEFVVSGGSYTNVEFRGTSQAALALTKGTNSTASSPSVEIFNSGNFGIVAYRPTVVSSNYVIYYALESSTNRSLEFQTEGIARIFINQGGNVSIGSTNNTYKLDVSGTGNFTGALSGTSATFSGTVGIGVTPNASWNSAYRILQFGTTGALYAENGDAAVYLGSNNYIDSVGYKYLTTDFASLYSQENGVHTFRVAASGTANNAITWTNALTIASTGAATFSSSVSVGSGSWLTFNNVNTIFSQASVGFFLQQPDGSTPTTFRNSVGGSQMTITSGGNVGINTNDPQAKLEVKDGHVRLYDPVSTAGAGYAVIWASNNGGTNSSFATIEGVTTSAGNRTGDIKFNTSSAGAPTEKMRITSGGNVQISSGTGAGLASIQTGVNIFGGTSVSDSQAGVLTIGANNNSVAQNTAIGVLQFYSNDASGGGTGVRANIQAIADNSTGTNYALTFGTGAATTPTERMRITSDGWIKTRESTSSTTAVHILRGDTTSDAVAQVNNNNVNNASDGILAVIANRNTTDNTFYAFGYYNSAASAWKLRVADSGNVTNTNNSYGSISDIKLKENITDASPKLEDLLKVKIKNFNFIGDNQKQLGVIAQELEEIFPSMIDETPDRDADGNYLETKTKSVKYSVFVPMLIKAIQEQQAQIEEQKADIESLKTLINK